MVSNALLRASIAKEQTLTRLVCFRTALTKRPIRLLSTALTKDDIG